MKRCRRDEHCSSGIADAFSLYLRFPPDSTPVILGRPMVVPTEMWDPLFVEEFDFRAYEVDVRGNQIESVSTGFKDNVLRFNVIGQTVVNTFFDVSFI